MALAKKRSNSTRIVIIGAVIIAVGGIGYVLFNQFFLKPNNADLINAALRNSSTIKNFGEEILNDPRYKTLKSYDATVNADANLDGGQPNPFQ